jgi:malate synthase
MGVNGSAGVEIVGTTVAEEARVLTPEALEFVAGLERRFRDRRAELLERRRRVARDLAAGALPDFPTETAKLRNDEWKVAPIPADLQDRRVEITGPTDRKMIINALNSFNMGARVFMADFEDSNTPTWENLVAGQKNLQDAVRREIEYVAPDSGKVYRLGRETATLMVRPRGWHLPEAHLCVDGRAVSASLFDFGLFFFHNARELLARGTGPYFYLPKMESHLEARLWNEVFLEAQRQLGLPAGTIRATVLIETILAAFEMDEILFELKDHSAGLNCGRWDYIFSFIKKFSGRPDFLLPDRSRVTMDKAFLKAYSELLVRICHRRGIHAMGGMAAQIPIRTDAEANRRAIEKVEADKRREVFAGHDGTWVAHPGLVEIATRIFDESMPGKNQIGAALPEVAIGVEDLLRVPEGPITEAGLRHNVRIGILYLESWLRGTGCVPLDHLMEDAATAEISRSQVWQWLRHGARLDDGRRVDESLYRQIYESEVDTARSSLRAGRAESLDTAAALFDDLARAEEFPEFLTLPAYEEIVKNETRKERIAC